MNKRKAKKKYKKIYEEKIRNTLPYFDFDIPFPRKLYVRANGIELVIQPTELEIKPYCVSERPSATLHGFLLPEREI